MSKRLVRCHVYGDKGVGKSSLIMVSSSMETVTESSLQDCRVDPVKRSCDVHFNDISLSVVLQEVSRELDLPETELPDVFIICYQINSTVSFYNVRDYWYPYLVSISPEVPILLIGTKMDQSPLSGRRWGKVSAVSLDAAKKMSAEIKAFQHFECSVLIPGIRGGFYRVCEEAAAAELMKYPSRLGLPWWLQSKEDKAMSDEALYLNSHLPRGATREETQAWVDSMFAVGRILDSPPSWIVTGTEDDRVVFEEAKLLGAPGTSLVSRHAALLYLDTVRAQGGTVNALPSWATDAESVDLFAQLQALKPPSSFYLTKESASEYFRDTEGLRSWYHSENGHTIYEEATWHGISPEAVRTKKGAMLFLDSLRALGMDNRTLKTLPSWVVDMESRDVYDELVAAQAPGHCFATAAAAKLFFLHTEAQSQPNTCRIM